MNIQSRKLEFIQEFLEIQSEDVILHLENLLKMEKNTSFQSMTIEELNNRVDQSESDFKNGKTKTNAEMLDKYT